jgi:hypothetical protein
VKVRCCLGSLLYRPKSIVLVTRRCPKSQPPLDSGLQLPDFAHETKEAKSRTRGPCVSRLEVVRTCFPQGVSPRFRTGLMDEDYPIRTCAAARLPVRSVMLAASGCRCCESAKKKLAPAAKLLSAPCTAAHQGRPSHHRSGPAFASRRLWILHPSCPDLLSS